MRDIVERLRFRADENYEMLGNIHEPLLEAADEIERLRAALRDIIADSFSVYAIHVARAALDGQPAPGKVEPRTDSRYNNAERIFGDD